MMEGILKLSIVLLLYIHIANQRLCLAVSLENKDLVTFASLSKFEIQGYKLSNPLCIQPDILSPDEFIVADNHAVLKIFSNKSVSILAGDPKESGFFNAKGMAAFFNSIADLIQINEEEIIILDSRNYCIRKLDRTTQEVTTFAGSCGRPGNVNGTKNALNTSLPSCLRAIHIKEENILYYLGIFAKSSIMEHNLTSGMVRLVFEHLDFNTVYNMVIDSRNEYIYVTHNYGLSKVNRVTWTHELIVGSGPSMNEVQNSVDGSFSLATFSNTDGLAWLLQDQVLVASEYSYEAKLRIINLVDKVVASLCRYKPECTDEPRVTLGKPDICQVNNPGFIGVYDGVMFVTSSEGAAEDKNWMFLKMQTYIPICKLPVLGEFDSYSPTKQAYMHLETVSHQCKTGYAAPLANYNLTCSKDFFRNGTITGKWDPTPVACMRFNVTGIHPDRGQLKGGTVITVLGLVPEQAYVTIKNSISNQINQEIMLNQSTFIMQADFSAEIKQVSVVITIYGHEIQSASEPESFEFSYLYLPNPQLREVSKQSSFISGGTTIEFTLDNAGSAYSYTLLFYIEGGNEVPVQRCDLQKGMVLCDVPDFNEYVKKRARRDVPTDYHGGGMTLRGDGEPVNGGDMKFFFYLQNPVIFNMTNETEYVIGNNDLLTLSGRDLRIGAVESDYDIVLQTMAVGGLPDFNFSCPISELTESMMKCKPSENENMLAFQRDVIATVQVSVGNLVYTPGNLTLIPGQASTGVGVISPAGPVLTQQLTIGLSVAGSLIVILIVAVVAWFCYQRSVKRNQAYSEMTELQDIIKEKHKDKLEGYFIDPTLLSFDPESELLGSGQFGQVYKGQLLVGDTLKTVAIKTLKESENVGIHLSALEDFLEEACFLKGHHHKNVLGTVGIVWKKGDKPVIILPYMAKGSLRSLLKSQAIRFTTGDMIHFGMQIACGMQYLSENGFVHRDLATRNCLVTEQYIVRISDFGMSRDVSECSYYREGLIQRPKPIKWLALESLTQCIYNTKTDVWSFGILLWELFTRGEQPYKDIANNEMKYYLSSGNRLPKTKDIDNVLYEAMMTCWHLEPEKRPSFSDLHEFLKSCLINAAKFHEGPDSSEKVDHYVRHVTSHIADDYTEQFSELDTDFYVMKQLSTAASTKPANDYVDSLVNEGFVDYVNN